MHYTTINTINILRNQTQTLIIKSKSSDWIFVFLCWILGFLHYQSYIMILHIYLVFAYIKYTAFVLFILD